MSHHISPSGAVEFCPPLQMARDFINGDASNLVELFRDSMFLADLRKMTAETSRGCILLEDPGKCGDSWNNRCDRYYDSGYGKEEYQKMNPVPGHDMEGRRFPSRMFFTDS